nr:MAG TPA: hypothetical protein [Caudoviricetes sp.]
MMVNHRNVMIEIVYRRWQAQKKLCKKLRERSLEKLRDFTTAHKDKSYSQMTDGEFKRVIAIAKESEAAEAAVRAEEKRSEQLYKQLIALYGIE